jgi:predicted phosphoribosyltransferase
MDTMNSDRTEAGYLLATKLRKFMGEDGVVLAIPRGGVPVAYPIAHDLGFPLELALIKKIGHPRNKEYAIGAASLHDYVLSSTETVDPIYVQEELRHIRERLREMQQKFLGDREPIDLKGKTVIVVDDGIATGHTLMASVQMIRRSQPARIIIAVPVAAKQAIQKLKPAVEELVSLLTPTQFGAVGAFYRDFSEVSDEEVKRYLNKKERKFI